jgi:hypothetical protein
MARVGLANVIGNGKCMGRVSSNQKRACFNGLASNGGSTSLTTLDDLQCLISVPLC